MLGVWFGAPHIHLSLLNFTTVSRFHNGCSPDAAEARCTAGWRGALLLDGLKRQLSGGCRHRLASHHSRLWLVRFRWWTIESYCSFRSVDRCVADDHGLVFHPGRPDAPADGDCASLKRRRLKRRRILQLGYRRTRAWRWSPVSDCVMTSAPGTTTIMATYQGQSATLALTVSSPLEPGGQGYASFMPSLKIVAFAATMLRSCRKQCSICNPGTLRELGGTSLSLLQSSTGDLPAYRTRPRIILAVSSFQSTSSNVQSCAAVSAGTSTACGVYLHGR